MQPHNVKKDHADHKAGSENGDSAAPHRAHSQPQERSIGRKLAIGVVVLAVVLGLGFTLVELDKHHAQSALAEQTRQTAGEAPSVDYVTVGYAPATQSMPLPGVARGWYQSTIYARVNGYVQKWLVDIGDRVKKGQVLAVIETPDLDAQLSAAQHQLAVSQSEVDVAQANADFAESTYKRWEDSPRGVVSEQEREEKKAEYASGVARLKAAQAKVSADQANVAQLAALASYKQVTAPFDGVITARHIDIGDLVTAGSTSNTSSLYNVAQIREIRVFIDVPQRDTAGMAVGVPATATTNADPGKVFAGKIARTSDAIDPQSMTLHVEVDINNPDLVLVPGTYMEVTFRITHKGLLQVPAAAMMFPASGPQIAVITPDNRIAYHHVNIALDRGDFVELSSGVAPGDRVALNLSNQIADGDLVAPNNLGGGASNLGGAPPSPPATAESGSDQSSALTSAQAAHG